jgi:hypothetical protein
MLPRLMTPCPEKKSLCALWPSGGKGTFQGGETGKGDRENILKPVLDILLLYI